MRGGGGGDQRSPHKLRGGGCAGKAPTADDGGRLFGGTGSKIMGSGSSLAAGMAVNNGEKCMHECGDSRMEESGHLHGTNHNSMVKGNADSLMFCENEVAVGGSAENINEGLYDVVNEMKWLIIPL